MLSEVYETLEINTLLKEMSRLENSVAHLQRSNHELKEAALSDADPADFLQAIGENESTIASQSDNIKFIKEILENRSSSNDGHYGS